MYTGTPLLDALAVVDGRVLLVAAAAYTLAWCRRVLTSPTYDDVRAELAGADQ